MHLFGEKIRSAALEALIEEAQEEDHDHFEQLKQTHRWEKQNGQWKKEERLAVHNDNLKREILKVSSVASVPRHSYVFCQYINPSLGHDGGPCTCYDVKGGW
jgi:hypothetical protein